MITVNTNMASIIAQNSLYKSTNKMNTALQRLSTGLRINSAKDDAAGSAISTKLEYKVSSYDVAKDNAQMGQSMLDTANGTLSSINSMLQRMRDLSEQAANGTYGEDERRAMQSEIDALTEEIYRIKNTTEFNGKKILGEEERPKANKMTEAEAIAQGFTVVKNAKEFQEAFYKKDENGKGNFDLVNGRYVKVADGTGQYNQRVKDSTCKIMLFADINLNELGFDETGSNWTAIGDTSIAGWEAALASAFSGTIDGNGFKISNLKIVNSNKKGVLGDGLISTLENGQIKNLNLDNVKIDSSKGFVGGIVGWNQSGSVIENVNIEGEINGSSTVGVLVGRLQYKSKIKNCIAFGSVSGDATCGGLVGSTMQESTEISNCYTSCKVACNNNGGSLIGNVIDSSLLKINNCFYNPNINGSLPRIGSGDSGDFQIHETTTNPFKNNSSISVNTNLQVGIDSSENSVISIDTGFSIGDFNISVLNDFSARNALDTIDSLMSKITDKLTDIGSTQNRLISTMEFQEVQRNALTSANSLIKDADIAEESANYIKNQILQSVTSSILATANQNPQIALQLI